MEVEEIKKHNWIFNPLSNNNEGCFEKDNFKLIHLKFSDKDTRITITDNNYKVLYMGKCLNISDFIFLNRMLEIPH